MKCNLFYLVLLCLTSIHGDGQEEIRIDENTVRVVKSPWKMQEVSTQASLRGLHVLDAQNIWASGTNGTVVNSNDGGQDWRVITIAGAKELDVRDIHAINESTIIAMTSGSPARIYRTTDAGSSWKMVYGTEDKRIFFDAISFFDDQNGIAMSDPVDGRLFLLSTADGGLSWRALENAPTTNPGEGGFAASGTNMTTVGEHRVIIGLGSGLPEQPPQPSRVVFSDDQMKQWKTAAVPMRRHPSAGIFSIAFANNKDGLAVGGDYEQPDATEDNYAVTHDGGVSWEVPERGNPPTGYRSGTAAWIKGPEAIFVAVGTNGTDLSTDLGENWTRVSNHGFHAIQFSPDGKSGWATGSDGRIAKWVGTE
jgi:photosystem II stability/assembly factor-like uncharacterized protein